MAMSPAPARRKRAQGWTIVRENLRGVFGR